MLDTLRPYIISFVIGFLIGLERERRHPKAPQAIGMRTIVLFALLGTLAAELNNLVITITLSTFVFGAILLGYFRTTRRGRHTDVGLTTEISAGVVYCLGYLALTKPLVASVLGVAVLAVLFGKERLHKFAHEQITTAELQAAITITFVGIAILPFLPNDTIDPWGLFNPRRFGLLVLLLAVVQFIGYVAIRAFGHRLGSVMLGFFGGLVSSTAVFATMPRLSKKSPLLTRSLIAAAMFAIIGMLLELLLILFVAAPQLLKSIIWPVLAMIAVAATSAVLVVRKSPEGVITNPTSPLDVKSVAYLALFIASVLILASLASRFFGPEGVMYVNFLGALFEAHGVLIATATLFVESKLSLINATETVGLIILASFVSKFILLWALGRNLFALWVSLYMLMMLGVGFLIYGVLS